MAPELAVGHAVVDLHVPPGTPLGGYADRTEGAAGTLDPIQVHAVTVTGGGCRFVWAVADVVCVNTDVCDAVRAAVPYPVWLSATHTHAGPETGCRPGGGPTPTPWRRLLVDTVTTAAAHAVEEERPARLLLRHGELTGVAGQRSGAHARTTVPYSVLEVEGAGVIVVLPVHPTVLPAENLLASADLPGAVRRAVTSRIGSWCVVVTGAAGDVSTRPHRRDQTPAEVDRLGELVAGQVVDLLRTPGDDVVGDGVVASVTEHRMVSVPARTDPPPDEEALAELERHVATHARGTAARRDAYTRWQGARLAHLAQAVREPRCAVEVLCVGDLVLAAVGAEPYLDLAGAWRTAAGPTGVLVGYTGGYLGYLPTLDAYDNPEYEVAMSPCGPGAAERVIAELSKPTSLKGPS